MKQLRLKKLKGLAQGLIAGEWLSRHQHPEPLLFPTRRPACMEVWVFLPPLPWSPQLPGQFLEKEASGRKGTLKVRVIVPTWPRSGFCLAG